MINDKKIPRCPPEIKRLLLASFADPKRAAYGQAATAGADGAPHVRTVHFHYDPESGAVLFATHLKSRKWTELGETPRLAGCHHDTKLWVQFRWEGPAERFAPEKAGPREKGLLDVVWSGMRAAVRAAYWQDYGEKGADVKKTCPSIGLVLCRPEFWDVFVMHPADYRKGRRTIYTPRGRTWKAKRVSLLHGGLKKGV